MTPTTHGTSQQLPTLDLTPLENTLKSLLLDVAEYSRDCDIADGRANAEVPKTVLRFTGGWVRDKLLGVESHDVDVAINTMTGYQFGVKLKEYLDIPENLDKYRKNHKDGELQEAIISLHKIEANPEKSKHLETVTTRIFGLDIDLVNLRKETYSEESRTPQMEFGTAKEDALRRDATINALFYNLNESTVEDLTGRGLEDMRDQIIRTPLEPYQTFKDDPLRVLRLIRFASRLGFRIDTGTENAMQHSDIRTALKLKISRERVGIEVEKMLRGPDPRGALDIIDRLNLYPTIFANHQDDAVEDTSSWSLAYNALHRLLSSDGEPEAASHVLTSLVRDPLDHYYSWILAAFAPWSAVPTRVQNGNKGKPIRPRMAEVARDSLRADNKMIALLSQAGSNWRSIIDVKTAVVEGHMQGTPAEIRQQVALHIRSWRKDWRLCVLLSLQQEIMQGADFIEVVQSYDRFLSYIVEQDLKSVCEVKPILNGGELMKALGATNGPWLSKALELVMQWQLLHPEIEDKQKALEDLEQLRDATPQQPTDSTFNGCNQLWQEISSKNGLNNPEICQNLLMVERFLKIKAQENLPGADKSAVNNLYNWASGLALPSPVFQDESRRRSTLALSVISLLADLLPVHEVEGVHNVVIALASFTSETDPWTTPEAYTISAALLKGFVEKCEPSSFWTIVESTLKARIKPLFAKTKNPAITASGRKNYHPVPLPRFDLSTLDPESKPWRVHDVYITTTFSWIVTQYQVTDCKYLEAHFPLLVPPILTLIDDDSLPFKRLGCLLLSQLLIPIRESQSDILRRTNLSSVFEDAIRPSFHSLPTITPEDDSIQLLAAGYPALRSLLQTSYRPQPTTTNQTPSTPIHSKNEELFISTTTKTLRDHLIPSFHHISSTNTTAPSAFTSASFPHPRLSTLLLDQIATTCTDLSIHTTKYLQDIIPLIYSTLSNPFGTANPPLLLSAVSAARAVILTAYPRIWRWRGEFLGAICSCWIHTLEDEEESKSSENRRDKDPDENKAVDLKRLKKELQGLVYLIKYVLANPVSPDDLGQREAMGGVGSEIQMLVDADESLKECLLADVDSDDLGAFGLNPDPIK
ncbi:hypothetical protein BDW59DRAFT_170588 [Aspergillus cavernicola]|uniref:Poly A polymerase head domain-containing protein n=1 Tax=Aspergillus cavernicola TaxID=176166 RepID=A0ABR4IN28_9EURO